MSTGITFPFSGFFIPGMGDMTCLPPWMIPPPGEEDFAENYDQWVKGDLSSKEPDELAQMINNWTGSAEDLILMVMIAVTKDMDKKIREKAEEVFQLRQKANKEKGSDKNTEALDQAVQELQQMQKQRDQFFQMMQKILDGLTSSTDRVLQGWKT